MINALSPSPDNYVKHKYLLIVKSVNNNESFSDYSNYNE